MGHGDEPFPAEVIDDLRDDLRRAYEERKALAEELSQAQSRIAFFEHSQAAGQHPPLPPRPPARPLIHLKLIEVMREVTSVAKTGMNTQQNYPFRGIDGVMNEVGPAMRKVGVLAIPTVLQYKNRDTLTTGDKKTREVVMEVRYDFYAEDGSSVSAIVWGESLDFSDKGTAKALSVALRQALLQTLMLPTQEPTTDDNGHYHTRAGTPTLSGWTAKHGRELIDHGSLDEVIGFWPAVVESSSIEAPSGYADKSTWGEGIAERIGELVAAEKSPEVLREMYGKLKAADMIGLWYVDAVRAQRSMIGDLVVERGKQAIGERVKAFDHCMQLITGADNHAALDNALVHCMADRTDGPLTQDQYNQLLAVANERRIKMPAGLPAGEGAPDEFLAPAEFLAPVEFLPAVGGAWDVFVAACGTDGMDVDQLDALLTGEGDTTPAAEFGMPGLLRVIDAIKRCHQRDHSIGATERAALLQEVREYAHAVGIIIPDANL